MFMKSKAVTFDYSYVYIHVLNGHLEV